MCIQLNVLFIYMDRAFFYLYLNESFLIKNYDNCHIRNSIYHYIYEIKFEHPVDWRISPYAAETFLNEYISQKYKLINFHDSDRLIGGKGLTLLLVLMSVFRIGLS